MDTTRKIFMILFAAGGFAMAFASPAFADDGQFVSTLAGAGVGGFLGSMAGHGDERIAATTAGVLVGGIVGNELGQPSYGYARPVTYQPAYYQPVYPNDDMFAPNGFAPYQPNYVAPPAPPPPPPITYVDGDSGQYCREFSETVRIGNQTRETYGTACLQPDGSWHVVP